MKTKTLLVTLVLATVPSLAAAMCSGAYHDQVTMSCPEGQTFDMDTNSCITPTG